MKLNVREIESQLEKENNLDEQVSKKNLVPSKTLEKIKATHRFDDGTNKHGQDSKKRFKKN